jgi:hypothetical protein
MPNVTAQLDRTGIPELDSALQESTPSLQQYVNAASQYVLQAEHLSASIKKKAQIRLSLILARVLVADLQEAEPSLAALHVGERKVSGALRTVNADVSEIHELDGLRLAVEVKPVNLAIGRAIWNRFGDVRTFAVNLHLKFPFAVVGGVLAIPTVEYQRGVPRSAVPLIERAVDRFARAGGRKNEGEAAHLLEAIAVVAYDPANALIQPDLPAEDTGLRWEQFVNSLIQSYRSRFEV